eukprot:scaffold570809_cov38-Prasinocladus_malaysianus.AAC.1
MSMLWSTNHTDNAAVLPATYVQGSEVIKVYSAARSARFMSEVWKRTGKDKWLTSCIYRLQL